MDGFENFPVLIARDICSGVRYLHNNGVAHRDLKPMNALVTNQHYCTRSAVELTEGWRNLPLVCKLTDFGESRSVLFQTCKVLKADTQRVDRGTIFYMATELLCPAIKLTHANQADLKRTDIWSIGMIVHLLYNPDLSLPYMNEILSSPSCSSLEVLMQNLNMQKKPEDSHDYEHVQKNISAVPRRIRDLCLNWVPKKLPLINQLCEMLLEEREYLSRTINLRNSQNSVLDAHDQKVAKALKVHALLMMVQTAVPF